MALPDARIIAGSVRPFKELLAACEDRELAAEALRCVHANDFVGLDARVAKSAESEAVKVAISELPRLHGGAEVLDRVDALLAAAGIVAPLTRELRALVEGLAPEDAQVLSFDFSIMNSFDYYTGLVFKAYAGGLPRSGWLGRTLRLHLYRCIWRRHRGAGGGLRLFARASGGRAHLGRGRRLRW